MDTDDTPAGRLLRAEIERDGPVSFERFMEVALYHPECGYYRSGRDPFGVAGDFYTAAQLQPAFGRIVREVLSRLPAPRVLFDWGAGRGEMREAFADWRYIPVEAGDPPPPALSGFVLANELFDALPVRVQQQDREVRVGWDNGRFRFLGTPDREVCPRAAALWVEWARVVRHGYVLVIDYGYDESERARRFPYGSLMAYRRHRAPEDVLLSPGEQDITAHVNFTRLQQDAAAAGFRLRWRRRLSALVLDAGEDVIAELSREHAPQLKTLLFGLGETFDAFLFERVDVDGDPVKSGPE